MSLSIFSAVTDYPTMLNKIAIFTFATALLLTALLRATVPSVDSALSLLNMEIPLISETTLPLGTVLPAFVIAFLSRALKFHDRLSDAFGIRQRFDVMDILYPLALLSGATLSVERIGALRREREGLMSKAFYKYASSTPGTAVIDTHYITMALDQWAWYWIVLEAAALATVTSLLIVVLAGPLQTAYLLLVATLLATGFLQLLRRKCAEYALQEVELIIDDSQRRGAIRDAFNALHD